MRYPHVAAACATTTPMAFQRNGGNPKAHTHWMGQLGAFRSTFFPLGKERRNDAASRKHRGRGRSQGMMLFSYDPSRRRVKCHAKTKTISVASKSATT